MAGTGDGMRVGPENNPNWSLIGIVDWHEEDTSTEDAAGSPTRPEEVEEKAFWVCSCSTAACFSTPPSETSATSTEFPTGFESSSNSSPGILTSTPSLNPRTKFSITLVVFFSSICKFSNSCVRFPLTSGPSSTSSSSL
ncbi:hypothetical protein HanXRQr2_Chr14g0651511 [Helianthus annuus]|uniref:Uncharacterized protein n=1 Tax=Helianthus annuus TaxID=4232 RepID=A0A9K3H931_HELAN|nr:hypothetical protein HanXRQr2_Chr14g0651511 [Helianthus annuus]KAJ0840958.1 hypothetical protein HanPSC8_Chr14g0624941 [Helianthus annuus]